MYTSLKTLLSAGYWQKVGVDWPDDLTGNADQDWVVDSYHHKRKASPQSIVSEAFRA